MNITEGAIFSVRHYSGTESFRSIVHQYNNDTLTAKITKDFIIYNIFEGDPIVLGFDAPDGVYLASGNVEEVSVRDGKIKIKVESLDCVSNKRKHERFPVSVYAEIKPRISQKKCVGNVKNVSLEGMLIHSKEEFKENEELEIDMKIDNRMYFLMGKIVWKVPREYNYEYGIEIISNNLKSKEIVKQYIDVLKKEQDDFVNKLRGL